MKIPVIATGLSGLVGTRIAQLTEDIFEFHDLSLATGVDITDLVQLEKAIEEIPSKIILHMAAKTDVDACEDDKILGEEGSAWLVNVVGTENIVHVAQKKGIKIIYISTDFVFDGTKETYEENDTPNPVNWYGYTKYEGEQKVLNADSKSIVVRIAYPYRSYYTEKKDFVRKILELFKDGQQLLSLTDHIITPTFIDDISQTLIPLLTKNFSGIFHVVGSQSLKVIEATKLIADIFEVVKADIKPILRNEYFKDRAFRPFKLLLKNDKIRELGINMKRFDEGLIEMKKQLSLSSNN